MDKLRVKSIEWGASARKCIWRGGDRNSALWGTIFQSQPTPPLPMRHDAPSRAMAKKRATTTPFLRAKVEGTGSRGDGGPSAPAPPSTEFEARKKKNERTNEGPRKQRGAFDFRRRGVSIYFLQLSLVRVDFQSVFATLNLKRTHAHRKICLPLPPSSAEARSSSERNVCKSAPHGRFVTFA